MIIYIDKTIATHNAEGALNDEEARLFERLAISHKDGHCLLCGHIDSLEYLIHSLDDYFKPIYIQIRNKQPELRSLIHSVSRILVISYSDVPSVPSFFPFDENHLMHLTVSEAIDSMIYDQCSLICENMTDCAFYTLIGERYRSDKAVKAIQISFRKDPGGGGTMYQMFKDRVTNQKTCALCLVDSDLKHGNNPPMGNTAKKMNDTFQEIKHTIRHPICDVHIISVHEAENLIPFSVLDKISKEIPPMKDGITFLRKLEAAKLIEPLKYYDMKNGDKKIKDPKKLNETDPAKLRNNMIPVQYWDQICAQIGETSAPPLCDGLLDKAVKVLGDVSQPDCYINYVVINDFLIADWTAIGQEVFSWGCSNKPTSTHSVH